MTSSAEYPRPVWVPCDVVGEPSAGVVDVVLRHGIEAEEGKAEFRMAAQFVAVR